MEVLQWNVWKVICAWFAVSWYHEATHLFRMRCGPSPGERERASVNCNCLDSKATQAGSTEEESYPIIFNIKTLVATTWFSKGRDGRRCGNICMMQSLWVMQRLWARMRSTWLTSQWVNVNHCLKTFNGCSLPLESNPNSVWHKRNGPHVRFVKFFKSRKQDYLYRIIPNSNF